MAQATLADFMPDWIGVEPTAPAREKKPCPYCGEPCAAVFQTVQSGNWVKPYHVGPVRQCPAFAHWVFPWCDGSCVGCSICEPRGGGRRERATK